ncbi:unnamed protein product [Parascedosporium putredinis]|uniref:HRDC domain-containing protein n=1 Tax=Parascedosporium putredinis TaxID=1442378 RepID=A0A9P1H598_9PEZI|nr:unnamed protein product [Parascedosporium putredinis]CAI7999047.1 unnamed protein product [Parascedosporium putredinis]
MNQCAEILLGKRKLRYDEDEHHDDDGQQDRPPPPQCHGAATHLKKYEIERIIDRLSVEGALTEENLINKSRLRHSDEERDGVPTTRNGYQRDDFVVDSDDDDYFEPLSKKRKSNTGLCADAPPLDHTSLNSLPEIHQEVVRNFVSVAKDREEEIRNNNGLRRPLFGEKDFQQMAIHWTITLDEMKRINGIDQGRVNTYGEKFLRLIRDFYGEYTTMMGAMGGDDSMENVLAGEDHEIVDLVSCDEDDSDAMDMEADPSNERQSRFFTAPVAGRAQANADPSAIAQWHQRLQQASQSAPAPAAQPLGTGQDARPSGGRRAARGGWKSRGGSGRRSSGTSRRKASGVAPRRGLAFLGVERALAAVGEVAGDLAEAKAGLPLGSCRYKWV